MTPLFFLLVVFSALAAPIFSVVLCGLLVHHGIWSLEWAVPTLWGVVSLRSVLFERSDGRGRAWRVLMLGLRVLALLLLGLSVAHIFHHWLSPFWRYLVASILFLFAIVWRGELHRRLPDPLAIPLRRLPSPWTFPTGSRR